MATDPMLGPDYKYSINKFTGNGAQTSWNLNFSGGYIRREHVKAYTQAADGQITELSFTWSGPNTIVISPPVAMGVRLYVYRDTPKSGPLVDFTDGAIINEYDLDMLARQTVFAAAEMVDRFDEAVEAVGSVDEKLAAANAQLGLIQDEADKLEAEVASIREDIANAPNLVTNRAIRDGSNIIPASFRTNLQLGPAALLGVGTGANTVAAGNDTRIVNAVSSAALALPSGSSMIGHLASPGITVTLADVADRALYATAYGCDPTGSEDASDKLQAAVNAAATKKLSVILPARLRLTKTITLPEGVTIVGPNTQSYVITVGTFDLFRVTGSNVGIHNLYIEDTYKSGGWDIVHDTGAGDTRVGLKMSNITTWGSYGFMKDTGTGQTVDVITDKVRLRAHRGPGVELRRSMAYLRLHDLTVDFNGSGATGFTGVFLSGAGLSSDAGGGIISATHVLGASSNTANRAFVVEDYKALWVTGDTTCDSVGGTGWHFKRAQKIIMDIPVIGLCGGTAILMEDSETIIINCPLIFGRKGLDTSPANGIEWKNCARVTISGGKLLDINGHGLFKNGGQAGAVNITSVMCINTSGASLYAPASGGATRASDCIFIAYGSEPVVDGDFDYLLNTMFNGGNVESFGPKGRRWVKTYVSETAPEGAQLNDLWVW